MPPRGLWTTWRAKPLNGAAKMPAIRQPGRINDSTTLIDIGMYGVAGLAAVYLISGRKKCLIDGGTRPAGVVGDDRK